MQALSVHTSATQESKLFERPVVVARYNPQEDTGKDNAIWLTSVISNQGWTTPTDLDLIITETPLYMCAFGFWDWIKQKKGQRHLL